MGKQRIDYRPRINYLRDYYTTGPKPRKENIVSTPYPNREPFDTTSIPTIAGNIEYLDMMIGFLPAKLAKALREVYEPVRDIYYDTLIDKLVDPNLKPPEIIIMPTIEDSSIPNQGGSNTYNPENDTDKTIYPIILRPLDFRDLSNPNPPEYNNQQEEDKNVYPIVLSPIDEEPEKSSDKATIDYTTDSFVIHPIALSPISAYRNMGLEGIIYTNREQITEDETVDMNSEAIVKAFGLVEGTTTAGENARRPVEGTTTSGVKVTTSSTSSSSSSNKSSTSSSSSTGDDDDDVGMWGAPNVSVSVAGLDIPAMLEKEFVFLLVKLSKHYTDKLKDIINNYFCNTFRHSTGQDEDGNKFISSKLELTSNDITNHSKHLFDSSVKSEDVANLKTDFFANVFNIKESLTHIRSFYLSNDLRTRYTDISYSKGGSMANSISDITLTTSNSKYEVQYRKSFENVFRYLESSLKITEDILRIHVQDRSNKSTIIKKGGLR